MHLLLHLLLLLLPLLHLVAGDDCMAGTVVVEEEDLAAGTWSAAIILTPDVDLDSWIVQIKFDKEVYLLESAMASVSGSAQEWTLACKSWDCALPAAASLTLKFIVVHAPNDQALPTEVAFPDADTALCHDTSYDCSTAVTETGEVEGASWTGVVEVAGEVAGWTLDITFSAAVTAVESAVADVARVAETNWLLTNKSWDGDVGAGEHLSVPFIVDYTGDKPLVTGLLLNGANQCTPECTVDCSSVVQESKVTDTSFQGLVEVPGGDSGITTWVVTLQFSSALAGLASPLAEVAGAGHSWTLTNLAFDGEVAAGASLPLTFSVTHAAGARPAVTEVLLATSAQPGAQSMCTRGPDCP